MEIKLNKTSKMFQSETLQMLQSKFFLMTLSLVIFSGFHALQADETVEETILKSATPSDLKRTTLKALEAFRDESQCIRDVIKKSVIYNEKHNLAIQLGLIGSFIYVVSRALQMKRWLKYHNTIQIVVNVVTLVLISYALVICVDIGSRNKTKDMVSSLDRSFGELGYMVSCLESSFDELEKLITDLPRAQDEKLIIRFERLERELVGRKEEGERREAVARRDKETNPLAAGSEVETDEVVAAKEDKETTPPDGASGVETDEVVAAKEDKETNPLAADSEGRADEVVAAKEDKETTPPDGASGVGKEGEPMSVAAFASELALRNTEITKLEKDLIEIEKKALPGLPINAEKILQLRTFIKRERARLYDEYFALQTKLKEELEKQTDANPDDVHHPTLRLQDKKEVEETMEPLVRKIEEFSFFLNQSNLDLKNDETAQIIINYLKAQSEVLKESKRKSDEATECFEQASKRETESKKTLDDKREEYEQANKLVERKVNKTREGGKTRRIQASKLKAQELRKEVETLEKEFNSNKIASDNALDKLVTADTVYYFARQIELKEDSQEFLNSLLNELTDYSSKEITTIPQSIREARLAVINEIQKAEEIESEMMIDLTSAKKSFLQSSMKKSEEEKKDLIIRLERVEEELSNSDSQDKKKELSELKEKLEREIALETSLYSALNREYIDLSGIDSLDLSLNKDVRIAIILAYSDKFKLDKDAKASTLEKLKKDVEKAEEYATLSEGAFIKEKIAEPEESELMRLKLALMAEESEKVNKAVEDLKIRLESAERVKSMDENFETNNFFSDFKALNNNSLLNAKEVVAKVAKEFDVKLIINADDSLNSDNSEGKKKF